MANFQPTPSFYSPRQHQIGYQNVVEEEGFVTLLIKHLPEAIPPETLSRLFSHYGASAVRPGTGGRLKNCTFVDFKNDGVASKFQCIAAVAGVII